VATVNIVVGIALLAYAVLLTTWVVREHRRMLRRERAFTEAVRAEEQAKTAALIEQLREWQ
jgi:hypothetical protein